MTNIWMPIYWGDYTKKTSKLTLEQHGAYLLLMREYWNTGEPLPENKSLLYRACGAILPNEQNAIDYILNEFFVVENGKYINLRIDEELKSAKENKDKRSDRASKAANARWNAPSNATSNALSNQQAMHNECPSPSPSPTSNNILLEQWENKNGELNVLSLQDWINTKSFDENKIAKELELFKSQCQAKGYKYKNFKAAFQKWCLNEQYGNGEKKFKQELGGNHY